MRAGVIAILAFLLFLDSLPLRAQSDSLSFHTDLYFLSANQSFQPHWQVSNKYGIFDRSKKTEFAGLFGLNYSAQFGKKLSLSSEIEFNLKSELPSSHFQQLYLNLHYGSLQLKAGKEAYTIGQYSEKLSSGSLFLSNNSRPMPRVGIGFYDYTPVPWIGKYVEFKGMINFGVLDDDRSDYSGTDRPWYHEKFFYLRSKTLSVNLHAGLNHSALFGGTRPDGTQIPVDFWATFLGKSSGKVGGGDEINVAGAHFGLYDVGFNWKIKNYQFQTYFQKPFSDGSGMRLNSKDLVLGILINRPHRAIFESINYEYIITTHQSGAGLPDPIVNGKFIAPGEIEDYDQFMLENFDIVTVGWTESQLMNYLEQNLNYGHKYTGRDDHYNNYLYPVGNSYHQRALGNSLMLNKSDLLSINPTIDLKYDRFFVSNRVEAHHIAFSGSLNEKLSYRTKLTYSLNHGSYAGANKGRYNWASMEDPEYFNSYYFKEALKQGYSFFELNYFPFEDKGVRVSSSIAYDFGEMYHNFGVLFSFSYSGIISLKKNKD